MNEQELIEAVIWDLGSFSYVNSIANDLVIEVDCFTFTLNNNKCLTIECEQDRDLSVDTINKIHKYMIDVLEQEQDSNKYSWSYYGR